MKILLIVVLFLSYTCQWNYTFCFTNKGTDIYPDTSVIKQYHAYVNKAEINVIEGNYRKASIYYDSSFSLPTIPFAQDFYNASVCEIKNKNYKKATEYCLKLVEKGCDKHFFAKHVYSSFRSESKYWNIFMKQYDIHRNYFIAHSDITLIDQLKKMVVADQNFFCERPKRLDDNIFLDSLFKNDQYISNQLTDLFQRYGYLSENIIGANVSDTTMSIYPLFNVLIRHHYQLRQYDLSNLLYSAMRKGELKPDVFCSWYTFQKKPVGYGEDFFIIKYKCQLYQARNESIQNKIAYNRRTMYLPSLDELKQKIIYTLCKETNELLLYAPIAIIPPMDGKSEVSFKERNTLLPDKIVECR